MTPDELRGDYNFQEGFGVAGEPELIKNVVEVIAAVDGDNDGDDWVAIGRLDDGRYFKIFAGCDYTGWG